MIQSVRMRLAATLLVSLVLTATARAGDEAPKGFTAKGKIVIHKVKMEKDQIYLIEANAKEFAPNVIIPGVFLVGPRVEFGVNVPPRRHYRTTFTPFETKEYQVGVVPDLFGRQVPTGTLDYTLSIKPLVFAKKPLLKAADMLTDKDQKYAAQKNAYYKAFPIKFKAGETYVIDHVRAGTEFKFDPYLYLEDAKQKVVAQDDDGGGNLNARIVFTPQADGEFRIIATTLSPATGDFTLTVRGTAPAQKE